MLGFRRSFGRMATVASLALLCATSVHAQEKVQLRLNLQTGQTFDQVIALQQKTSQTVQNRRTDMVSNARFGIRSEVLEQKNDGAFKIKMTYCSLSTENRITDSAGTDLVTRYDSSKPANKSDITSQMLAALIGQSVISVVSSRGEVLSIEGVEEMVQRMLSQLDVPAGIRTSLTTNVKNILKSQTGQTVGLTVFPESSIAVGESWTTQNSQSATVPLLLATRYTLAAAENGVANLNVQSKITGNTQASAVEIAGTKSSYDLSGTQSGVMRVDESNGLPQSFELHQRLAGRVFVTNAKTPKVNLSFPVYMKSTVRGWTVAPR